VLVELLHLQSESEPAHVMWSKPDRGIASSMSLRTDMAFDRRMHWQGPLKEV